MPLELARTAAPAALKSRTLRRLAELLRDNVPALQADNARDLARAEAAGLAAPLVDRLRLTPKVLETCAQGCEQLAAMAAKARACSPGSAAPLSVAALSS